MLANSYPLILDDKGANQSLAAVLAGTGTNSIGVVGSDCHAVIVLGQ